MTMGAFVSMDQVREAAGRAASAVLPDEVGDTMPVATRRPDGVQLLVLYHRVVGPPMRGKPTLPTHAMLLDPRTAKVVRFWKVTPDELGLRAPLAPVPGVGADMTDMPAFLDRRARFFAISPDVWEAFEQNASAPSGETAAQVKEYWELFRTLVSADLAPHYVGAAKDFFDWVRAIAGAP